MKIDKIKLNNLFGDNTEYKKGNIVVWNGFNKAILRIKYDFKVDFRSHVLECAKATYFRYDSLHYSNLRLANKDEVKRLGNLEIIEL